MRLRRGNRVLYTGFGMPFHHGRIGRVIGRDRRGWVTVDFGDGVFTPAAECFLLRMKKEKKNRKTLLTV